MYIYRTFRKISLPRLSFGIASAPEVFQNAISHTMKNLPSARGYVNDVLIWETSRKEHEARLRAVLQAARAVGLTPSPQKREFGTQEIRFLDDLIWEDGIKPDKGAVQCFTNVSVNKI